MNKPIPTASPNTKLHADHNAEWDSPDVERLHHASEVVDRGMLDSIGRAVSAPLLPPESLPATPDKR